MGRRTRVMRRGKTGALSRSNARRSVMGPIPPRDSGIGRGERGSDDQPQSVRLDTPTCVLARCRKRVSDRRRKSRPIKRYHTPPTVLSGADQREGKPDGVLGGNPVSICQLVESAAAANGRRLRRLAGRRPTKQGCRLGLPHQNVAHLHGSPWPRRAVLMPRAHIAADGGVPCPYHGGPPGIRLSPGVADVKDR